VTRIRSPAASLLNSKCFCTRKYRRIRSQSINKILPFKHIKVCTNQFEYRTVLFGSAFENYATKIWNNLPQDMRDIVQTSGAQRAVNSTISLSGNINIFKSGLKTVPYFSVCTQAFDGLYTTISEYSLL